MIYANDYSAFCRNLKIAEHPATIPFFEQGAELYRERGNDIFDKNRLLRLNEAHHFLRIQRYLDAVLNAADLMSKNPDLAVYNYALYIAIRSHANTDNLPAPDFDSPETDFSPFFAFLYGFDAWIAALQARKLPEDVISDTLQGFEAEMNDYSDMYGRPGMRRYVNWFLLFIHGELLRIGRLNFQMTTLTNPIRVYRKGNDIRILMDDAEMHRLGMLYGSAGQDDEAGRYHADITVSGDTVTGYAANKLGEVDPEPVTLTGYKEVLRRGDPVLSVHIPATEPFTAEICQASYERAKEIFARCYPEFRYRAFVCYSWMMEKRLEGIMGRSTNITRFADKFHGFPLKDSGADVYIFLYHLPDPIAPENLPENSSMQKAVKQYLCSGNFYFEKGGLFLDV